MNIVFRRKNNEELFKEFCRRVLWATKPEIIRDLLEFGAESAFEKHGPDSYIKAVVLKNHQCLKYNQELGWEDGTHDIVLHSLARECRLRWVEDFLPNHNGNLLIGAALLASNQYLAAAICPEECMDHDSVFWDVPVFVVSLSDDVLVLNCDDFFSFFELFRIAIRYDLEVETMECGEDFTERRHWLFDYDYLNGMKMDSWIAEGFGNSLAFKEDSDVVQDEWSQIMDEDNQADILFGPNVSMKLNEFQIPKSVHNLEIEMSRLKKIAGEEDPGHISLRSAYDPINEFYLSAEAKTCVDDELDSLDTIQRELFFRKSAARRAIDNKIYNLQRCSRWKKQLLQSGVTAVK